MQKILNVLLVVALIAVIIIAITALANTFSGSTFGNLSGENNFNAATVSSVNTSTTLPMKVLSHNDGRKYAIIVNDSTSTVMYLYLTDFASGNVASTTVLPDTGVRLNYGGEYYEIDADNLYTGEIWVATTTNAQKILTTESN